MMDSQIGASLAPIGGALNIDKPKGMTSHDVVNRVRRVTGIRRVGHAGTLDPFATGVLVCCIGRATRLVQFLVGLDKEYLANVRLGFATDTQDGTGKQITPIRSSKELSLEDLRRTLEQFTGPQLQTPPMFSAKKVAGEKLYQAARAGRDVPRDPVSITLHSIELIGDEGAALIVNDDGTLDFRMRVRCSSGTYIRTLAHDLGERLEVGAHLIELRRTAVGHFHLADALTLEELESTARNEVSRVLIEPTAMLSHLAVIELDDDRARRVATGRAFSPVEGEASIEDWTRPIRLCDRSGKLIGIGTYDSTLALVRPIVVMEVGPQ